MSAPTRALDTPTVAPLAPGGPHTTPTGLERFFHAYGTIVLIVLVLIGAAFRVYDLGGESLWIDEGTSVNLARSSARHIIEERAASVNPPLYFLLLHGWVELFGDSEAALRSLSVVFAIASLGVIYALARRLFDQATAIFATGLLALSAFHVAYAQEARAYSLTVLLSLSAAYFLIRLAERVRAASAIGYVLSAAALMYTHFSGVLVVLALNLFVLTAWLLASDGIADRRLFRWWLPLQGGVLLLFAPWIGFATTQLRVIQRGYWIPRPTLETIRETLRLYSNDSRLWLIVLGAVCVIALAALVSRRTTIGDESRPRPMNERLAVLLLLLWALTPTVVPYVMSLVSTPIYYPRFTISASVGVFLLAARGMTRIGGRSTFLLGAVVATGLIAAQAEFRKYYPAVTKQQWREVGQHLHANVQPGDLFVFNHGGIKDTAFKYYFHRSDVVLKPFDLPGDMKTEKSVEYTGRGLEALDDVVRGYPRVWLVLAHTTDPKGLIKVRLAELYRCTFRRQYKDVQLLLFESPQPATAATRPATVE